MPSESPDTTSDSEVALLCAGARSPTKGNMSCGVTVVMPQMKDTAAKDSNCCVRHSASHCHQMLARPLFIEQRVSSRSKACTDQGCCKGNKSQYIRSASEDITKWAEEEQSGGIASLE